MHVFNNLVVPAGWFKSYSVYAGVQDAFMQWWYGHNAVAFFLTTPFLGLMYYFLPKAAERPVFSYKLSIIHFWSLVFVYIWAGPHHLHYTALPEWASTLGMLFSLMLWMPSWGGMINGLLTLRGAWNKVTKDPILKFYVVGITFYGMSTFEGPMLSIKSVNALSHYTDWTIAHVHSGALGWNGFMVFGMVYWLLPRIFQTKLWSEKLMSLHFWTGTIGILLYIIPIYAAGLMQGLMWRAIDNSGNLAYPDFVETIQEIKFRCGCCESWAVYCTSAAWCMLAFNAIMTWMSRPSTYTETTVSAPRLSPSSSYSGSAGTEKRLRQRSTGTWLRPLVGRLGENALAPQLGTLAGEIHRPDDRRRGDRDAVRSHPDVPDSRERSDHRNGHAVHAVGTGRTRHLRQRRLLQLSLANGAAVRCRDQAVWRLQQAG